jgi:2-iminobutanoate/2-iminopropanoate deaminase
MRFLCLTLFALSLQGADRKAIFPPGVKPVGPYSPGIMVGDYLYVSGQGARDTSGKLPEGIQAQTEQCLQNIKTIVEAAGLTMDHIVYTQAYLTDMGNYEAFNSTYARAFASKPPARTMIGVARMPTDTPVEISAVAIRDLNQKKPMSLEGAPSPLASIAIMTSDRLYVSGILGRDADTNRIPSDPGKQVDMALQRVLVALKTAKLKPSDVRSATVYVTSQIPVTVAEQIVRKQLKGGTIVPVNALPLSANVEITAIASSQPLDTVYLPGKTGDTTAILNELKAQLATSGMTMDNVVASNVYIDDINQFATMNSAYATFFTKIAPTRTTVQPTPVAPGKQNMISLIAVK